MDEFPAVFLLPDGGANELLVSRDTGLVILSNMACLRIYG